MRVRGPSREIMSVKLIEDGRLNPAYLKLDLFCKGMTIHPSCSTGEDGRAIMRTRAGLGSGLEMIIPPDFYTNAPVAEDFAANSPYSLRKEDSTYFVYRDEERITPITLPKQPDFYTRRTSSGKVMSRVGVLQGTYLAIYPTDVCAHWKTDPPSNCGFCSVGLNLGEAEDEEKSVQDVVDTAKAAREEEKITFVHFNTGYYEGDTYLDVLEPYIKAVHDETGLLIGVQTPPHPDFSRYDKLKEMGVNNVSFCFELWDEDRLKEICPGKATKVGLKRYLDATEYCAKIFDTTNGEIVAGLEPIENSIAAIDWITSVGAIPTVCVFRPLKGTVLEDYPSPRFEDMLPVFVRFYEACMEKGLPVGIAPNIKVSIVMLPDECRWLLDEPNKYRLQRLKLATMKSAFNAYFHARLKLRG